MPECENCEEFPAAFSCGECDLAMCEDCDSLMHKPRKFKLHKRSPVPEEKSQASNTGDKKADPEVIKNNKIEAVVCMDDDEVDGGGDGLMSVYELYNELNQSAQLYNIRDQNQLMLVDCRSVPAWNRKHLLSSVPIPFTRSFSSLTSWILDAETAGGADAAFLDEVWNCFEEEGFAQVVLYDSSSSGFEEGDVEVGDDSKLSAAQLQTRKEKNSRCLLGALRSLILEKDPQLSVRVLIGGFNKFHSLFPFMTRDLQSDTAGGGAGWGKDDILFDRYASEKDGGSKICPSYRKYPSMAIPNSLYYSNSLEGRQRRAIHELAIDCVVDLNDNARPVSGEEAKKGKDSHSYIHNPCMGKIKKDAFRACFDKVYPFIEEGKAVLVHNALGNSNGTSGALCCMILMKKYQVSLHDAYTYVREQRNGVCLSSSYTAYLSEFEQELFGHEITDTEDDLFFAY